MYNTFSHTRSVNHVISPGAFITQLRLLLSCLSARPHGIVIMLQADGLSLNFLFAICTKICRGGPDSSVGIVTCYRLDGPGIESPWGRDFPHQYRPALGPTHSPIQWVPRLSRGAKRQRRGVGHPPLSSAEVEGRRELYICSPSGTSWPVIGWPLPLPFAKICQYITGLGTVGQK